MVFNQVIRQPCWCTKQYQIIVHVLQERVKFPKDFFLFLCTNCNMAVMTSGENHPGVEKAPDMLCL